MMDDESTSQELVKCVLVGDNAVGKTRLICAKACRQKSSLSQLLNPHVPTVWAIDQYRIYKEVLENSWSIVDGVNVSLRLWDTFGDHHKDRRFAYGRSDVVLMCFDIGRASSLENCREMWYAQIKRFCPNTPVILVGCKNDLRFIHKDETYLQMCRQRSPLIRRVIETDIVMPEEARTVARELGVPYYETSVLTYFGIDEMFENAIRAALCTRRQASLFGMTNFNLRRVLNPGLQQPFCPPRPKLPSEAIVLDSSYLTDLARMARQQNYTDLIFLCGTVGFSAHRFMMASASPLLRRILTADYDLHATSGATRSNSETSLVSSNLGSNQLCGDLFNDDTECLIPSEGNSPNHANLQKLRNLRRFSQIPANSSQSNKILGGSLFTLPQPQLEPGVFLSLNYPAFQSLRVERCESLDVEGRVITSVQTVLTCSKLISPQALNQVIQFVYGGQVDTKVCNLRDMKQAAEFLDIPDLFAILTQKSTEDSVDRKKLVLGLEDLCLSDGVFSDILFKLEDGTCAAHKSILMARSDMMCAMFTHEAIFKEASARVIHFPGVSKLAFFQLLYFLYTDKSPLHINEVNCVDLIELANRLCLPRLVSLVEASIIQLFNDALETGSEISEETLKLLQPCQVHNAGQLGEFCLRYLSQNYNSICRKFPKILRNLHPENQACLNVNRWPPIWYLKDHDNYQRMLLDQERLAKHKKPKNLKRVRSNSGCLCFSSSKSRKDE